MLTLTCLIVVSAAAKTAVLRVYLALDDVEEHFDDSLTGAFEEAMDHLDDATIVLDDAMIVLDDAAAGTAHHENPSDDAFIERVQDAVYDPAIRARIQAVLDDAAGHHWFSARA